MGEFVMASSEQAVTCVWCRELAQSERRIQVARNVLMDKVQELVDAHRFGPDELAPDHPARKALDGAIARFEKAVRMEGGSTDG